jgi:hypothetical protein
MRYFEIAEPSTKQTATDPGQSPRVRGLRKDGKTVILPKPLTKRPSRRQHLSPLRSQ